MKLSIISAVFVAAALQASAQSLTVTSTTFGGSGCPQTGSPPVIAVTSGAISYTPPTTLTASVGPGVSAVNNRRFCQIGVSATFRFAQTTTPVTTSTPSGNSAAVDNTYFFSSAAGVTGTGTTSLTSTGTTSVTNTYSPTTVWSSCGGSTNVNINTALRASGSGAGSITIAGTIPSLPLDICETIVKILANEEHLNDVKQLSLVNKAFVTMCQRQLFRGGTSFQKRDCSPIERFHEHLTAHSHLGSYIRTLETECTAYSGHGKRSLKESSGMSLDLCRETLSPFSRSLASKVLFLLHVSPGESAPDARPLLKLNRLKLSEGAMDFSQASVTPPRPGMKLEGMFQFKWGIPKELQVLDLCWERPPDEWTCQGNILSRLQKSQSLRTIKLERWTEFDTSTFPPLGGLTQELKKFSGQNTLEIVTNPPMLNVGTGLIRRFAATSVPPWLFVSFQISMHDGAHRQPMTPVNASCCSSLLRFHGCFETARSADNSLKVKRCKDFQPCRRRLGYRWMRNYRAFNHSRRTDLSLQPPCEVQFDKASVEITSPFDDLVKTLLAQEGEIAKRLHQTQDPDSQPTAPPAASQAARILRPLDPPVPNPGKVPNARSKRSVADNPSILLSKALLSQPLNAQTALQLKTSTPFLETSNAGVLVGTARDGRIQKSGIEAFLDRAKNACAARSSSNAQTPASTYKGLHLGRTRCNIWRISVLRLLTFVNSPRHPGAAQSPPSSRNAPETTLSSSAFRADTRLWRIDLQVPDCLALSRGLELKFTPEELLKLQKVAMLNHVNKHGKQEMVVWRMDLASASFAPSFLHDAPSSIQFPS
ncbi:hypothetical protein BKA70DRAFT_1227798 [Coprinopsis sp. MPI-PUGE-AT-0042]|nr:hypothetical protein BKA70DRAFT_1227798 [Coprinopsis sp. MPI-PUGE-AT-0042]